MTNLEKVELLFPTAIARFMEGQRYPLAEEAGIAGKWETTPAEQICHQATSRLPQLLFYLEESLK